MKCWNQTGEILDDKLPTHHVESTMAICNFDVISDKVV